MFRVALAFLFLAILIPPSGIRGPPSNRADLVGLKDPQDPGILVRDRYRILRFRHGFRVAFFREFSTLLKWFLFDNGDHVVAVMSGKFRVDPG